MHNLNMQDHHDNMIIVATAEPALDFLVLDVGAGAGRAVGVHYLA